MDIKVVIRKGMIYGISLIIALAVYTYFALVLKSTIEESWDVSAGWTAAILIALVALGFPPLKKLVEKGVDKLFKGKKSIDLAVKEVREKLSRKTNIQELVGLLASEIKNYLSVNEAKVYILNKKEEAFAYHPDEYIHEVLKNGKSDIITLVKERNDITVHDEVPHLLEEGKGNGWMEKGAKEMKKRGISVLVPLSVDNELIGFIGIGGKADKSAFTVQDIQYLERVREQTTPTLANAMLYQEAVERIGAVERV